MSEEQPSVLESQILKLEQEIAQKRAELGVDVVAPVERAEVQEAIGEQIQEVAPEHPIKAPAEDGEGPSWQDPALAAQVQELVNVAFSTSIQEAITQAVAAGNPALVDALHDVLVDQLHQELVNRKKLQPTP
jgi:hypothetical protein